MSEIHVKCAAIHVIANLKKWKADAILKVKCLMAAMFLHNAQSH